jgi:predicted permease
MPAVRRILDGVPSPMRSEAELGAAITPIQEEVVGDSRRLLFLLLGAVGALLLISCSNVSNMLLSRSVVRRREIAVRTALGASSGRIVWQLLHENLLLFIVGGTLGALCAMASQQAFLSVLPSNLPQPRDLHIDTTVLAFTLAMSVVTGLIFGLAPALGSLQMDLRTALQDSSRGSSAGRLIGTMRKVLVVGQIALTVVLLTSAGLLVKSFFLALDKEAQLQTEQVITFGVALPREQYPADTAMAFYRELSDRLRSVPTVKSIGLGTDIPLEGRGGRLISPDQTAASSQPLVLDYTGVEGAYFQSLAMPLVAGRVFDGHDRQGGELVAVVNEAFGRAFWPGRSAVDRRFKIGPPSADSPWIRIVGVVGNVSGREAGVIAPHAYVPLDQEPLGGFKYQAAFVLRTSGPALNVANVVRNAVQSLDPALPVLRLRSMEQVVSGAVAPRSANAQLVALFGLAALLLSALGVYGVVAYSVSERTREIGIRLALGAARSTVWRWAAWEGVRLAIIGLIVGLPAALGVGSLIRTLLYGVSPQDAVTLIAVAAAVGVTSIIGTLIPSWRAMRVDPMIAVRNE